MIDKLFAVKPILDGLEGQPLPILASASGDHVNLEVSFAVYAKTEDGATVGAEIYPHPIKVKLDPKKPTVLKFEVTEHE